MKGKGVTKVNEAISGEITGIEPDLNWFDILLFVESNFNEVDCRKETNSFLKVFFVEDSLHLNFSLRIWTISIMSTSYSSESESDNEAPEEFTLASSKKGIKLQDKKLKDSELKLVFFSFSRFIYLSSLSPLLEGSISKILIVIASFSQISTS